jgi:hypothetical protein
LKRFSNLKKNEKAKVYKVPGYQNILDPKDIYLLFIFTSFPQIPHESAQKNSKKLTVYFLLKSNIITYIIKDTKN